MDVFLSIGFFKGFKWNSLFSPILAENILSFIVRVLDPFGPVTVKFPPSILIEESLGNDIVFFPILDIKIPYK